MHGAPIAFYNQAYMANNVNMGLAYHPNFLTQQVALYFAFYMASLMSIALTLLSSEPKTSLVEAKAKLMVLALFLVGMPPLPSFFTKVALLSAMVNSAYWPLSLAMLVMYLLIWYMTFFIIKEMFFLEESKMEGGHKTNKIFVTTLFMLFMLLQSSTLVDLYFFMMV